MPHVSERDAVVGYRPLVVVLLSPLAFALVFASWTIFAVLGLELRAMLGLGELGFALMLATPMLTGALAALPMAALARRHGGRRVMIACLLLICPFLWAVAHSSTYLHFLLAGAGLGLGAGSLAAGLVYVAELSPRRHAGLALGLYGAGMVGAGLSYLLLPLISQAYGWRSAPLLYLLPVLAVAALLWLFADDPDPPADSGEIDDDVMTRSARPGWLEALRHWRPWRLAVVYSFFYGAFVALSLWLPGYLGAQYGLELRSAALLALPFPLAVGLGQVAGGAWGDAHDFRALRWWVSAFVLVCLFLLSYPPFTMQIEGVGRVLTLHYAAPLWGFLTLLVAMGLIMGVGQGSLMRMIHRDHGSQLALVGGLALTLGGLFGALLPLMFALGNHWVGIRTAGFMFLYASLVVCMLVMLWDHVSGAGRKGTR
ncbi:MULTISPECIES: MFS transporter [unclassified Halomonas]|uniref:MFS transporter n=1 Tax=unclassified Halomonas TaxID=2609666 RepID=UPI00288883C6|nr:MULTISPECIES: MFS transporter [unclassified Halomonas]MDT0500074.1 MFS transporter [Halomonas sp. PAR7]MDT0512478.1 MFS transporter [Halomonas sp. LES1]MDT0591112.1 MFS transporter [Halomonas sp. PAR8]